MISNFEIQRYCNEILLPEKFDDYCPNGLQVEGVENVKRIISGVSANQDLIDIAVKKKADAIFVHHGVFWKNESMIIAGYQSQRIKKILASNINLFAYHLPLDDHKELGNNIQLARTLGISNPEPIPNSLIWTGEIDANSLDEFSLLVEKKLGRSPQVFGNFKSRIKKIAWCTGGAQKYFHDAINLGVDLFITGEISEQIPAMAKESGVSFMAAGHHATERYGVQALCQFLAEKFNLEHEYVEIPNDV